MLTRRFSTSTRVLLDASKLQITRTTTPKTYPPQEQLVFGKESTDHMLMIRHTEDEGWGIPEIKPFANLSLDPRASVLHYAFECFEGLKAFKAVDGSVRLFRPDMNMARLNRSMARLCMPSFDPEQMLELIKKYVAVEADAIPVGTGYSLYLRPNAIGVNAELGVRHPSETLLYTVASPVGPYYPTGFKAIRLLASETNVRAWPGGVGDKKLGANYAPTVLPQREAAAQNYQQILWLFGPDCNVTEVGTMNLFFVFKDAATGKKELVTAPLDGTILEGVVRDSILALSRERLDPTEWTVSERYYTIFDVMEKASRGELVEAFGCGTAAVISPIKHIGFRGKDIEVPLRKGEQTGELTMQIWNWINNIQYGLDVHPWSIKV